MTNAVRHSRSSRDLDITLDFEGTCLAAEVVDHGQGFDVTGFNRDRLPDLMATSGRGLYLIHRLMDEVELRSGDGLEVRMRKRSVLPSASPGESAAGPALITAPGSEVHRSTRQRGMLDEVDDAFLAFDWEYRLIHANRALGRLLGRPVQELLNQTVWELLPDSASHAVGEAVRHAMQLGVPAVVEYAPEDEGRWLELRIYPTSFGISLFARNVSERKRVEEGLRDSRRRLELAQEIARLGSWELDLERNHLIWSDEVYHIFGLKPETFPATYEGFVACIHPDDRQLVSNAYNESLRQNRDAYEVEHRIVRPASGEVRFVLERCRHYRDTSGQVMRSVGMVQDITEQKRAEEALRRSEERLAAELAAMTRLHELVARLLVCPDLASALEEVLGATIEISEADMGTLLLLNQTTDCFEVAAQQGPAPACLVHLHAGVPGDSSVCGCALRSGQRVVAEDVQAGEADPCSGIARMCGFRTVQSTPLMNRDGQLLGVLATHYQLSHAPSARDLRILDLYARQAADVIGHARNNEELRKREEFTRRLVDCSPDCIKVLDLEGRLLSMSPTGQELLEIDDLETVLGTPWSDFWPEAHRQQAKAALTAARSGSIGRLQAVCPTMKGQEKWWDVIVSPILGIDSEPERLLAVSREVTQRCQAEAALRESEQRFRSLFESMTEGVALHELVYESHQAVDYRILQVNPAYERQTGLNAERATGQLASQLYGTGDPPYLSQFRQVAESGQAASFETYFPPLRRHFRITVVSPARGQFATIFEDITERKRADKELAKLYESQRDVALTLQRSFLHTVPELPLLEVGLVEAPASAPGLVGGDLWDLIETADGRVLALIGDVAGKGIPAAGLTWTIRSAVQALTQVAADPAFILEKVNALLLGRDLREETNFVTAVVLLMDPKSGDLTFASAGHPGPALLTQSSSHLIEPQYGPPLGALPAHYINTRQTLTPGDYLVLYTDGVTEARKGRELFGEERLLESLQGLHGQPAQEVASALRSSAEHFAGRLRDDLEVLVLRLQEK